MTQNVQTLSILKIEKDLKSGEESILFCGFAENQQEVIDYMENVQKQVDYSMQHNLQGEYLVIPSLYFNIQRRILKKNSKESKESKK